MNKERHVCARRRVGEAAGSVMFGFASGEPARLAATPRGQACCSSGSAIAAEALMNNAGSEPDREQPAEPLDATVTH